MIGCSSIWGVGGWKDHILDQPGFRSNRGTTEQELSVMPEFQVSVYADGLVMWSAGSNIKNLEMALNKALIGLPNSQMIMKC
ncbi:hypothetical protein CEXT_735651 [Caerostris extrusa]|uniref:Uncharacterized protein n=1 Tax=Caerostris extrusa TaxID=172846 RepID=A0AAV4VYX2_CAEEX|nr:hypothetical protein CEXT_735651 [Caerostris extrusa]